MQLLYHHITAAHPHLLATTACSKLLQQNILWESPLDAVDHCLKKLFLGTEESGLVIQPLIQQNSFKSVIFRILSYKCRQTFPIFANRLSAATGRRWTGTSRCSPSGTGRRAFRAPFSLARRSPFPTCSCSFWLWG